MARLLTPMAFDDLSRVTKPEHLWGLPAIAAAMGVCRDTVRRAYENPTIDIPVSKPGGRYYAARSELLAWMKRA